MYEIFTLIIEDDDQRLIVLKFELLMNMNKSMGVWAHVSVTLNSLLAIKCGNTIFFLNF